MYGKLDWSVAFIEKAIKSKYLKETIAYGTVVNREPQPKSPIQYLPF